MQYAFVLVTLNCLHAPRLKQSSGKEITGIMLQTSANFMLFFKSSSRGEDEKQIMEVSDWKLTPKRLKRMVLKLRQLPIFLVTINAEKRNEQQKFHVTWPLLQTQLLWKSRKSNRAKRSFFTPSKTNSTRNKLSTWLDDRTFPTTRELPQPKAGRLRLYFSWSTVLQQWQWILNSLLI